MRTIGIASGLATLLFAIGASAQSVSVTIRGTVADEQDAMLPAFEFLVEPADDEQIARLSRSTINVVFAADSSLVIVTRPLAASRIERRISRW
jgi:hypothetical protein